MDNFVYYRDDMRVFRINCGNLPTDFAYDVLKKIYFSCFWYKENPDKISFVCTEDILQLIKPIIFCNSYNGNSCLKRIQNIDFNILFNFWSKSNLTIGDYNCYLDLKQNLQHYLDQIIIQDIIE